MSSVNALAEPHGRTALTGSTKCFSVQEAHGKSHISSDYKVMNHDNTSGKNDVLQHTVRLRLK